jgi:hypothetical protein
MHQAWLQCQVLGLGLGFQSAFHPVHTEAKPLWEELIENAYDDDLTSSLFPELKQRP